MSTQTLSKTSNDLRFSTSKTVGKEFISVNIRLNDECKNGHQDFSITGDIYEAGKPRTDRYHISGGCIHEDIEKHFPEFTPFIRLHLCDYKGIPMHAGANGFYHLRNGFNNTPIESKNFKAEYCEYYRITPQQFDTLKTSENEIQFSLFLMSLGILSQWEYEASKAIATLEEMTDTKFIVDSKRTQFVEPTTEQITEEEKRQATGYYTPKAKEQRKQADIEKELTKLAEERDAEINKATTEFEVKKQVLLNGGKKALKNCIFYNHSKTLSFNWQSYDKMAIEELQPIIDKLQLPEGIKIEIK
jgi:hypothetical protein